MRRASDKNAFTPFGLWLQEYVNDKFSISNLDFVIEDYTNKRIQLIEEKQNRGRLHNAQLLTFAVLDRMLLCQCAEHGYDYWGFFLLQFPHGATMPGPGMTLNGISITCEQLQDHLNFEKQCCEPYPFKHRKPAP
jgi:hypothetical protein